MRSLVERFLALCRRLLGRRRVQGRTDDLAERESLDQIWRAECTEMKAFLKMSPSRSYPARISVWKVAALLGVLASPALADRILEGRVTGVRDVDTIVVAGTPVRLNGVDGPEASTRVGREARSFMARLVQGETVSCVLDGTRTYDRWVGICYLDGQDIGAIAIANGFALDCRRYSGDRYRDLETTAAWSQIQRAGYCR